MANALPLILLAGAAFFLMSKGDEEDGAPAGNGGDGTSGPIVTDEERSLIREHVEVVKESWDPVNDITPVALTFSSGQTAQKFYPEWTIEAYQSGDNEAVGIWNEVTQVYEDVFGMAPAELPPAVVLPGMDPSGPLGEKGPEIRAHVESVKDDWNPSVAQSPTNLSLSVMQTVQLFYPAWLLETYWYGGKQKPWAVETWDEIVKIYASVFSKAIGPAPLICNPTVPYTIDPIKKWPSTKHSHGWNFNMTPNQLKHLKAQGGDYELVIETTEDRIDGLNQEAHKHAVTLTKADIDKLLADGQISVKTGVGFYTSTDPMSYGEVKESSHTHSGIKIQCHYGDAPKPGIQAGTTGISIG